MNKIWNKRSSSLEYLVQLATIFETFCALHLKIKYTKQNYSYIIKFYIITTEVIFRLSKPLNEKLFNQWLNLIVVCCYRTPNIFSQTSILIHLHNLIFFVLNIIIFNAIPQKGFLLSLI